MKSNYFKDVEKSVLDTVNDVSRSMAEDFKGTEPYSGKPPDNRQLYMWLSQLDPYQREQLRRKHGEAVWDEFLYEMSRVEREVQNA